MYLKDGDKRGGGDDNGGSGRKQSEGGSNEIRDTQPSPSLPGPKSTKHLNTKCQHTKYSVGEGSKKNKRPF